MAWLGLGLAWTAGIACKAPVPTVHPDGVALTGLGWDRADAELRLRVDNPTPADVTLSAVRWSFAIADRIVVSGEDPTPRALPASTSDLAVVLPLSLVYADLGAAYQAADAVLTDGGTVPYRIAGAVDVAVGPSSTVTLALGHDGALPELRAPTLDVLSVDVGHEGAVGWIRAELHLGLPAWVGVGTLAWRITADGRALGAGRAGLGADGDLAAEVQIDAAAIAAASWDAWLGETRSVTLDVAGRLETSVGELPVALSKTIALPR